MQTDNPFLDGMARLFTDAACGAAQSLRNEIDTFVRQRVEAVSVADMNLVPREEFEVVKAMAAKARTENESPSARVAASCSPSQHSQTGILTPRQKLWVMSASQKTRGRGTLVPTQNLVPV